jgi:hypothetical protein
MGHAEIRVIDLQGRTAHLIYSNDQFGLTRTEIPTETLAPGSYWIEVRKDYEIERKKLIVQ